MRPMSIPTSRRYRFGRPDKRVDVAMHTRVFGRHHILHQGIRTQVVLGPRVGIVQIDVDVVGRLRHITSDHRVPPPDTRSSML